MNYCETTRCDFGCGNSFQVNYIHSEEWIDNIVNSYIDEQVNNYKKVEPTNTLNVYNQQIKSYRVNDKIASVHINILIANTNYSSKLSFIDKGFNFNLEEKRELKLSELFDNRLFNDLNIPFTDNFLLTEDRILFLYDNDLPKEVKYKKLKNYNSSFLLTAKNFKLSERKYNAIFTGN